ncbi:MAG: 4Fe-4S binding protein, partial [Candidatus Nezhaarchaeales archaeon]
AKIVDKSVTVNCNCCQDCCEFFLASKHSGVPMLMILEKSRYVAYVDKEACVACGLCVNRCHFNAITLGDYAKVDEEKCFGCGVCVVGCKQGAIRLKVVREKEHIPP